MQFEKQQQTSRVNEIKTKRKVCRGNEAVIIPHDDSTGTSHRQSVCLEILQNNNLRYFASEFPANYNRGIYLPLPTNNELLEFVRAERDTAHAGGLLGQPRMV